MTTVNDVEINREDLLKKATTNKESRDEKCKKRYDEIMAKAQEMYDKQLESASTKYSEFTSQVEADIDKRLKIVRKVIGAEAAERLDEEDRKRREEESKKAQEAEDKMRREAEKARAKEEAKVKRIAEKKRKKAKAKEMKLREKVPIPNPGGVTVCANSKKLYAKLKKLNSAGRYAFCCFYHPKTEKKLSKHFREVMAPKYYDNVAWMDCPIKDQNFEEAMLLYEFNATPAIVICFQGKPSDTHRFIIGDTPDNRECLERYAEKANAE